LGEGLHPRTAKLLASAVAAIVLVSVSVLLPVPYVIFSAGPAVNTLGAPDGKALIEIKGQKVYPTTGELDLTTVRLAGGPGNATSLWAVMTAWLDRDEEVVPREQVFPENETADQNRQQNQLEMATSQESATAAALSELGYTITIKIRIEALAPDTTVAGVLKPGDVFVSVGGTAITDPDVLRAALQKVTPGQDAAVVVERDGKAQTLQARTHKAKDGSTVLGISVGPKFVFPFDVHFQIDQVGGPSAGTMFALGIIDKLTALDMTGGRSIAGTGEINPAGTVGPIGGIRQKLVGARDAGADYFLAPAQNCDEVVGHIPDGLQVVAISTLRQARTAVEQIGRTGTTTGLPACR
jgi:PDZ domain-containing protein